MAVPCLLYRNIPSGSVVGGVHFLHNVWDSLLHVSSPLVATYVLVMSVYFAPRVMMAPPPPRQMKTSSKTGSLFNKLRRWLLHTPDGFALLLGASVCIPISALGSLPMLNPSWIWYPFAWGNYRLYRPAQLSTALEGICINQAMREVHLPRKSLLGVTSSHAVSTLRTSLGMDHAIDETTRQHMPLCLAESSWDTLSTGSLSSSSAKDVRAVMQGITYAQQDGHGLTLAVLARDIAEDLEAFRLNVESLTPFFANLAVVIFENDSSDGSRDHIREWATERQQAVNEQHHNAEYQVDLMECEEAIDCKFGKKHRDTNTGDYKHSKAIGDMDVYRQRITDYITDNAIYQHDYSHMLVLDIDLAVSLSPFGILHSLGKHPENAVASSGRQLFPMGFGSLDTPYDFSAFRPYATQANSWVLGMHEEWCGLMPAGDRWRNSCDAPSPFLFAEMLRADRGDSVAPHEDKDYYPVQSAFNGAVLYPLDLIRVSEAQYDAGEDGQRCEHIGFNLAMLDHQPMLVNRRWDMHVDPANMGGPTGWRAQNAIEDITMNHRVFLFMTIIQVSSYFIFVNSLTMLGLFLLYPLLMPLLAGGKNVRRMVSAHHRKLQKMQSRQGDSNEDAFSKLV